MRKVRIERRVRFGDTDPYGVLYFAALLDYFKEGVDEFLREGGESPGTIYRNREESFGFPVVSVQADYLKPLRYDELMTVECSIDSVGKKSVTFAVTAYAGDEIASRGRLTFSAISDTWESIDLPQRIANLIKKTANR